MAQALDPNRRDDPARPRARVGEVDVVSASLGWKLPGGVDPAAEHGLLPDERARGAHVRHGGAAGRAGLVQLRRGG